LKTELPSFSTDGKVFFEGRRKEVMESVNSIALKEDSFSPMTGNTETEAYQTPAQNVSRIVFQMLSFPLAKQ
jgi:hypothetical protein